MGYGFSGLRVPWLPGSQVYELLGLQVYWFMDYGFPDLWVPGIPGDGFTDYGFQGLWVPRFRVPGFAGSWVPESTASRVPGFTG